MITRMCGGCGGSFEVSYPSRPQQFCSMSCSSRRRRPRPLISDGLTARVPLTRGQVAVIDAEDAPLVAAYRWFAAWSKQTRSYYARTEMVRDGRAVKVSMHRLIMDARPGQDVDHRDHQTLNNRRGNLRIATRIENSRNKFPTARNTSGFAGVVRKGASRWEAYTKIDGRRIYIGSYPKAEDAALARDAWIREHCPSEFWTYNFPLLPGERGITQPQGATA